MPPVGLAGQVERQLDLVDDALGARAPTAGLHARLCVADAVELRPLRAGVRRRDRDERHVALRRHRLARVDRAAATERDEPVGILGRGDRRADARGLGVRAHAVEPARHRQLDVRPARARDQQRAAHGELAQQLREGVDAPADDHGLESRDPAEPAAVKPIRKRALAPLRQQRGQGARAPPKGLTCSCAGSRRPPL